MTSAPRKVSLSEYELIPRARLGARAKLSPRRGALLRVEWPEGEGFADLHPWPELGDPDLSTLLEKLRANAVPSGILARSLEFSRIDAEARSRGKTLFQGLEIPESHFLATDVAWLTQEELDQAAAAGFRRIKVKLGRDPREEAAKIRELSLERFSEARVWRFDFNASLTRECLEFFLDALGDQMRRIDFIEDPLPWNERDWAAIRNAYDLRLAADREKPDPGSSAFDMKILKPATDPIDTIGTPDSGRSFVVTSYLDHPLGQLCAAYAAARSGVREICGLLSQGAYERNDFSGALRARGPFLLAPEGTGFGFGELLAKREWKALR